MGAIIAKLWRRKTSTKDVLSKIRDDINDIEEFKQSTQAWHKKLIGYLLAYFSVIYLIAALVAYFKYFTNPKWRDFTSQLQLLTPFIVAPFIFVFLKRFLTWWYHRKIRKNEVRLENLKKQKAKILDEVMETETYKVAKEILDEFASDSEKRALNLIKSPQMLNTSQRSKSMLEPRMTVNKIDLNKTQQEVSAAAMELRKRQINPGIPNSPSRSGPTSGHPTSGHPTSGPNQSFMNQDVNKTPTKRPSNPPIVPMSRAMNTPLMNRPPPGPPLPRPVLPRERGYMDRVVEYLVGDGPSNRFALICKQCQSHNGMALREEFEYIAFRCAYCHYWNPARKQRPTAPKLENFRPQASTDSSTSSDEEISTRGGTNPVSKSAEDISKPKEAVTKEELEAHRDTQQTTDDEKEEKDKKDD